MCFKSFQRSEFFHACSKSVEGHFQGMFKEFPGFSVVLSWVCLKNISVVFPGGFPGIFARVFPASVWKRVCKSVCRVVCRGAGQGVFRRGVLQGFLQGF